MTRTLSLPALALLTLALVAAPSPAQKGGLDNPFDTTLKAPSNVKPIGEYADAKLEVVPSQAKPKETVLVRLTITPKNGGHTYPFFQIAPGQAAKNDLRLPPPGELIYLGEPK